MDFMISFGGNLLWDQETVKHEFYDNLVVLGQDAFPVNLHRGRGKSWKVLSYEEVLNQQGDRSSELKLRVPEKGADETCGVQIPL